MGKAKFAMDRMRTIVNVLEDGCPDIDIVSVTWERFEVERVCIQVRSARDFIAAKECLGLQGDPEVFGDVRRPTQAVAGVWASTNIYLYGGTT